MKRFLILLLVAAFVVTASNASAQPVIPYVPSGTESPVWHWDDASGAWVPNDPAIPGMYNGRLFRTGGSFEGYCNKKFWGTDFVVHASIAQWVDFVLEHTRFDWYVRKPGKYAGDCISYCISSNGDINLDYDGFGPLMPVPANPNRNPIDVYWGIEDGAIMPVQSDIWYTTTEMNELGWTIIDDEQSDEWHYQRICIKLWTMIDVIECNSACEYEDTGTITLTLVNQKDWILWDTGEWNF